jgi:hypothetical protein
VEKPICPVGKSTTTGKIFIDQHSTDTLLGPLFAGLFGAAKDKVGGSRPTGQQIERAFLIYRAKIKKIFFGENGRNRRNRVTLGKKSFIYIDLEETQSGNQKRNVTKVNVTSRGKSALRGGGLIFFYFFFLALYKQRG